MMSTSFSRRIPRLLLLLLSLLFVATSRTQVHAFGLLPSSTTQRQQQQQQQQQQQRFLLEATTRRDFGGSMMVAWIASTSFAYIASWNPQPAHALPYVTPEEFQILLRDSPLSIQVVEFSGPQSDIVTVQLVDGTRFGISGIVESSTDPRSPLKLAAACREAGVSTQFLSIQQALAAAPKRKKVYANARIQEAAEKEAAKQERLAADEAARVAAVQAQQEQAEAAAAAAKDGVEQ